MLDSRVSGFDWDADNLAKCRKHGVSIAEIEALFIDGPDVAPDVKHSAEEARFIAVGKTRDGRTMFVAFTMRTKNKHRYIRPVSARYMHEREAKAYEKEKGSTTGDR